MSLETRVQKQLWTAITRNYENENFTGAVIDSIHVLSQLIRDKTGLEGDGAPLVGQALGGKPPKVPLLKLNKLQTESDWNTQAGIEQILRGVYMGIRNPRSHGQHNDSRSDADAIILFLDYLIRIIDQSKTVFDPKAFLKERVFDKHFVKLDRYAQLVASEIPAKHRLDIAIEVFRERENGNGHQLHYFFDALHPLMTPEEVDQFCVVVSEELKVAETDSAISSAIQVPPYDCWSKYAEQARLRIEGMLITSIESGLFIRFSDECPAGVLGTWTVTIAKHFTLKEQLIAAILTRLTSYRPPAQNYYFQYLDCTLFDLCVPKLPSEAVEAYKKGLSAGDVRFYDSLDRVYDPFSLCPCSSWSDLEDAYKAFVAAPDEVPF